jgi:hypothetical protein
VPSGLKGIHQTSPSLFDRLLESKITRQAIAICPRDVERAAILRERVQSFSILL